VGGGGKTHTFLECQVVANVTQPRTRSGSRTLYSQDRCTGNVLRRSIVFAFQSDWEISIRGQVQERWSWAGGLSASAVGVEVHRKPGCAQALPIMGIDIQAGGSGLCPHCLVLLEKGFPITGSILLDHAPAGGNWQQESLLLSLLVCCALIRAMQHMDLLQAPALTGR